MDVREIMTPAVDLVSPDMPLIDAAKLMRDDDIGFLPIGENDRLVGTVTDRDIAVRGVAAGVNNAEAKLRDVMSPELVYCFENQDAGEAAALMADHQVRRLPVLNRDKRLVGVLSIGDIATGTEHLGLAGSTVEAVSRETPQ
jgi:CBS domain-containing protein